MRKFTIFLVLLLFVGLEGVLAQQTRVITGTVTSSEDKSPIPGVTVVVKGTTIGTTTNIDGKYVLSVPAKYNVLTFSFVGMKSLEVKLGESPTVDIAMESDIMKMNEVVVTAIGIPRETKALSYSVQNVGGDDIQKSAQSDIINSLQGKVSDVQIINSSGVAGAAAYIQIRGVQSLNGNNMPLFVVDGVPIESGTTSSGTGGGINNVDGVAQGNRAMDINPDDIESVNVLKGGAATALYGLRAASGAIIITTKKGHSTTGKKVSVNFNTSVQFDQVSKLPSRQNQYSQGSGGKWISGNSLSWGAKIDTCAYNPTSISATNPYWQGFDIGGAIVSKNNPLGTGGAIQTYDPYDFFQTGITTNNSLALSGGSDVSTFYFSFSDNQQKGIVPNNKFRRNTFKLSGETKLSDKFKIGGSVNYIITSADRIQQGSNTSGVMLGLLRTPCTFDNAAGYLNPDPVNHPSLLERTYRHGAGYDNPYWTANMNKYTDKTNRMIGSMEADYLATKWLTFTYRIGVDFFDTKIKDQLAVGSRTFPSGWNRDNTQLSKDFNQDIFMSIDKDFAKDFNLHFVLGNNMFQSYFTGLNTQATGLIIPEYYDLNNTTTISANTQTFEVRRAGWYGDLQLAWKSMVYLSVTGRNDWSTTLPEGKNSFFYPSVGGGFIFTQLPGLKDNKILPYGKLRVSYSIVAKDADPYSTFTSYGPPVIADGWTTGLIWPWEGTTGYGKGVIILSNVQYQQLGNNELKPEKTKSFEIGADLKFIENRIGLAYTYFSNKGEDLILPVPIATSTGYAQQVKNAGSMKTQGHEFTLDIVPIKTKNWEWNITVNFSKITNKVLALAPGIENLFLGGFTDPQIRAVVGQPYRSIYGFDWVRDPNSGKVVIDDQKLNPDGSNNDHYGYPTADATMKAIGNVDPDWTMGAGTNLRWKDLSLYLLFDIKSGGKMWDGTRGVMVYFGTAGETASRDENYTFDGVLASNPTQSNNINVKLDQAWRNGEGSGFSGPSIDYIEKSNWVRLRTVTLSYSLTKLLKKTFIKGLDIFFTGTNLWLDTPYKGIDPETNLLGTSNAQGMDYFNMPGTKSYTLGLNLAF
ncbi:MAG: SusC/RagA family TonB-linked outer membrane protein [Bacteroidetes bacterium]|nr:SusC/RagA family TonB-linked outer membrane protein [Bacteroidota bacterium]